MTFRNFSRQQEIVTNMYVEAQFHTILDQVFPEYLKVFGDLYGIYIIIYNLIIQEVVY